MNSEINKRKIEQSKLKRPFWKRSLRVLTRTVAVLIFLLILVTLFIRSPWGQGIIIKEITNYITSKTNTKVSIDKFFITFTGNIDLEGFYLEDEKKDTLIYSKKLQVEIPLLPIFKGNPISIDGLQWSGLRANIKREDSVNGFNYQFLIDSFSSDSINSEIETTENKPLNIEIGTISFTEFQVNYNDNLNGSKANIDLGDFKFTGKEFDLNQMIFKSSEISLENTNITYIQNKAIPTSEQTEIILPFLSLENIRLTNVSINYNSKPDSLYANLHLINMFLQAPKIDLNQQDILVNQFDLNNSKINVVLNNKKIVPEEELPSSERDISFVWPNWNIAVNSITLENNLIHYQVGEQSKKAVSFDPDNIALNNFNFIANNIELTKNNSAKLNLEEVSFREQNGLELSQFTFSAALKTNEFLLENLVLKTGNTYFNSDLSIAFSSIEKLFNFPEESILKLNLEKFNVDINDIFRIAPSLSNNEYLKKLGKHAITGKVKADGKLSKMNLSTFLVNWGQNTKIESNGLFYNLINFDKFLAEINSFTFNSNKNDISNFINSKQLGISIPKTIVISSQLSGSLENFKTKTFLTSPEGKINIIGDFKQQTDFVFDTKFNVQDFDIGKIINNPTIGKVTFKMDASGNGNNINDMNAKIVSNFSKMELNGYDYSELIVDGNLTKGNGNILLNYNDVNLNLSLDTKIVLDSIKPKIALDLNLEGADLYALGLSDKQIKGKLNMNATFKGNPETFDLESHIINGLTVYEEKTYYVGPLDLTSSVGNDSTILNIKSNFINGNLRANANLERTTSAAKNQLMSYFSDTVTTIDSLHTPVKLQVNMKLSETKFISEFLFPEIKAVDTLNFKVDFNQESKKLLVNLSLPYLNYANKIIDSLQFMVNSVTDEAKFKLGFNKLDASPILMNHTFFDGDFKNGLLNLHLHTFDEEKELYLLKTEISGNNLDLNIHLNPEKIIIHGEPWTIPINNEIEISTDNISVKNFVLSRNGQRVSLANNLIESNEKNIGLAFENFKLINILALLNKDNLIASGDLQGHIIAINPLEELGLNADFGIKNLGALQIPLGNLSLKANASNSNNYLLNIGLKGDDIDMLINGNYSYENIGSELDFDLNLNKIGMRTIAALSNDNLKETSGNISGKLGIQGNISAPNYKGHLQFNDAVFNISQLNSKFKLTNDKVIIDNDNITFNTFTIQDNQKNTFELDGSVITKNFLDPTLKLSLKAEKFQALNSTNKDNELFYGKVNFDLDGTIQGKISSPKVNMKIGINESTNFTYVLLDSQAELQKSDGIIEFVNKKNPDAIITKTDDSTNFTVFDDIELQTKLSINKKANFNVIVDQKTGDNLNISGFGDLKYNISKNGLSNLSGRYDINKGHYNLSLYNLVKREFELEPGSSIVWRGGGPMDADLNVTAKYSLETSASTLMASQTASSSEEVKNKYRQKLPFLVYLNVKGEIDQPELSFNLGMPEDSRGAIDGTVYSKIKQLNNEDDALNKQVFSLLVLRKFYPNSGSDGSEGGAASLVRQNLNDALSDQLNVFSEKLTGNTGIELDFGLNSYTDYQGESSQQRTDLNISAQKKLLDDRLIVQVGSNVNVEGDALPGEENPLVGNVSIQYLLTKDGQWRLKGFRDSEYENVIDGQVFVNGFALIFQRQFNKFNELFGSYKEDKNIIKEESIIKETKKNDKKIENN